MPTYCLCHHQENFFLGIDCVFFARSISAELDWQWSKKQEGIVRFVIDSKDTAQRMMCLVPKTSTPCAGHENEAHLRLESQEATRPKRPKQRHPVLFLRWPHHAWASLRQCFRPPCKLYQNQRTRPTVFLDLPRLHAPEHPSQIRSSCRARCHSVASSATGGRWRIRASVAGRHLRPGFRTGGTPQRRRPLVSSPSFVFFCDHQHANLRTVPEAVIGIPSHFGHTFSPNESLHHSLPHSRAAKFASHLLSTLP